MRAFVRPALCCLLLVAAGCGPGEQRPVTFEVPRGGFPDFLDTPWPSDLLRRDVDGAPGLDLRAFPNPFNSSALDDYVEIIQHAPGFSTSGTLYFHVEGGVDPASLPASARASVADDATLFLVELTHPERRVPLTWRYYEEGTSFLPPGTVAVAPLLGAIVRGPAALVVTSGARHASGLPLGPSADLRALMTCAPLEGVDPQPDCARYQGLAEALGRGVDELALLQVFTPYDATSALEKAFFALRAAPPPVVRDVQLTSRGEYIYDVYEGVVELAQFQAGTPPFSGYDGESGGFVLDDDGAPVIQRIEDVRFVLTVPTGAIPEAGWPLAINGHGTGGSLYTGIGEGPTAEAHQLASAGWASISISEPLHRTRAGFVEGEEEINTFNFLNPLAGRDNWRQSALEKVQLVSLAGALSFSPVLTGGVPVRFDASKVGYFGHSQGGITGALFVGVEDRIQGAFLSGAGAGFSISLVEKTEPVNIGEVLKTFLLMPADEPMDELHPVLALMQTWIEPSEPLNYGALWRHRADRRTPHLVATSGLRDQYTPPSTHAGLAGAFGLPIVGQVADELEVLALQGVVPMPAGVSGNLRSDRGEPLTAGLLQYPDDGHFAVYYNRDAQDAFRGFFETLKDGVPVAGP